MDDVGAIPAAPPRRARNVPSPDRAARVAMLRQMVLIRRFEERTIELFLEGRVKGTAHSSVGQEAVAAGACSALRADDLIITHHRGHGHTLARGADPARMMAELFGREAGYSRGLGGSMHIADLDRGILGANGIVGAGIGLGTGAALAAKLQGGAKDGSAACLAFFGDGAASEGIFHEALNLAAIWRLPVVYVCENNQYGLSTASAAVQAGPGIAGRAGAYGIPGEVVDGNDPVAVHEAVAQALARARAGEGPTLIECHTYRWGDHSMRANLPRYRQEAEEAAWRARDPIVRLAAELGEGTAPLEAEAREVVEAAIAAADASPEPQAALLAAPGLVTEPHAPGDPEPLPGPRALGMADALREAMEQEMARDPAVVVMGEDVAGIGGIFGATRGLLERFGPDRVRDTPIAEAGIAACAVGAAMAGLRPVVEVQIFDFIALMMDAVVNQAAKFRYMLGGKPTVPVVFRGPQGGGIRLAAQHSQSLEAWFAHVPGLVVLAPSDAYDAKGLLAAAIRDNNPVVFLEHKLLYLAPPRPVPEASYALPIGRAKLRRPGRDVTVVATLAMVDRAMQAAETLARDGIEAEVIDPRTLRPWDKETVLSSVRRTGRLLVVHEAWRTGGWGAEVAATVAEEAFDWLDAPPARLAAPDVPMPYNDRLEREVIPSTAAIAREVRRLVRER